MEFSPKYLQSLLLPNICLLLKLSRTVPSRNFELHMTITAILPSLDQQSVGNGNIHIGIPLKVNVGAAHPTCRPKSVKQTHHRPLPRGWTTSQILRSNSRCVWIVVCAVDTHTHTRTRRTHARTCQMVAQPRGHVCERELSTDPKSRVNDPENPQWSSRFPALDSRRKSVLSLTSK